MKILVCGGSRFKDKTLLYRRLDALHAASPVTLIINGGARGADYFVSQWAKDRGVPLCVYRADWQRLGVEATVALNAEMLESERPDLVLACPGGPVTMDMITRAQAAGVIVQQLDPD